MSRNLVENIALVKEKLPEGVMFTTVLGWAGSEYPAVVARPATNEQVTSFLFPDMRGMHWPSELKTGKLDIRFGEQNLWQKITFDKQFWKALDRAIKLIKPYL